MVSNATTIPRVGTKMHSVYQYLKKVGTITTREMEVHPFYINCPYRVIDNLRDFYKMNITDEYITSTKEIEINGEKRIISNRYKKYYLKENKDL